MKRLLIVLVAICAGVSVGCSSDDTSGKKEKKDSAWQEDMCTVGETMECYSGPKGTAGVGLCKAGKKACVLDGNNRAVWSDECEGEVLPDYNYVCDKDDPLRDSDCNGVPEMEQDEDGDGMTICDAAGRRLDCCDSENMCITPNMRAYKRSLGNDCVGDHIDGDCDGIIDNPGNRPCSDDEIAAARAEKCGDGILQNDEVCDDGMDENTGAYGRCNTDCSWAKYCGDGIVSDGEVCDDGLGHITNNKDELIGGGTGTYGHCKSDCSGMADAGYCGDGIPNGPEECDENVIDEDGHSKFVDANGKPVGGDGSYGHCNPDCTWAPYCGDGNKDEGEVCDDGLGKYAYGGTGAYGKNCKPDCSGLTGFCGDGKLDDGYEACDDGYEVSLGVFWGGDGTYGGCNKDCTLASYCGNGEVEGNEQCDNGTGGNIGMYGGCKSDCTKAPYCGDKIVTAPYEECDLGTDDSGKSLNVGGYSLEKTDTICNPDCSLASYCGDGIIDWAHGEECDDGSNTGMYGGCTPSCKKASRCGDGRVDTVYGEECDLKDNNGKDGFGCTVNCTAKNGWECSGNSCNKIPCGNGVIDSGEYCDDGIASQASYCRGCYPIAGYVCVNSDPPCPSGKCTTTATRCILISSLYGDGVVSSDFEDCDDGNNVAGDGCYNGNIERGYICPNAGKRCVAAACGDGILAWGEECDDGNNNDNDGCSGRCKRETGYACTTEMNQKTNCLTPKGRCGDGLVQYGEECDDGNTSNNDGCTSACRIEDNHKCPYNETTFRGGACVGISGSVCGNGTLDKEDGYVFAEECDLGSQNGVPGSGCSDNCKIETGYHCDLDGKNCYIGTCRNGKVDVGEECDDGNHYPNDGCSPSCKFEFMFDEYKYVEKNDQGKDEQKYEYSAKCGDGITLWMIAERDGEGKIKCTNGQTLSAGEKKEVCKQRYGNNVTFVPVEECDDGNMFSGDGCSSQCKIEEGWDCTDWSKVALDKYVDMDITYYDFRAHQSSGTGDGWIESSEASKINCKQYYYNGECYSTRSCSGYDYNGRCYKNKETCDGSVINNVCNKKVCNGIEYNNKCYNKCSSGYTFYQGTCYICNNTSYPKLVKDKCCKSSENSCKTTTGRMASNPGTKNYNDVYSEKEVYTNEIEFEYSGTGSTAGVSTKQGYPDFGCAFSGSGCGGMVNTELDKDGKPVLIDNYSSNYCKQSDSNTSSSTGKKYSEMVTGPASFYYWYRYFEGVNRKFDSTLTLTQDANDTDKYSYNSSSFYPFQNMSGGYKDDESANGDTHKYGNFTSELHTVFQYKGNETLSFKGDDDVWAFINRKLFVDLGGMQSGNAASNTLSSQKCIFDGVESDIVCDRRYDIYEDGLYDLNFFQAERCDSGSQYQLTLDGFLKTGKSQCSCPENSTICSNKCGKNNGQVDAGEECDCDSNGVCRDSSRQVVKCLARYCKISRCGDGIIDPDNDEECDQGSKNGSATGYCTSLCKFQKCGDGEVGAGEECDLGDANSDTSYGKNLCTTQCRKAPYCGDGNIDAGEMCDNGNANNDNAYGQNACTSQCKQAPFCGDGSKNGAAGRESCDLGDNNSATAYGENQCTLTCQNAGYCGDGIVNGNEECDYGKDLNKDGVYGGCGTDCTLNSHCGDGHVDEGYEICDLGVASNTGLYNGCRSNCTLAAYCGDGMKNGDEECDYGRNNETGVYGGCSKNCKWNARCGDGVVNAPYETCDDGVNDGSYGGCTSHCTKAAYCGDGIPNGNEECDYALNNMDGVYGGCSSTCRFNAYCGDGHTDAGYEQCDDGTANNDGSYGGCNSNCTLAPYCGDGFVEPGKEVCDFGTVQNTGSYGGCKSDCTLAPYCGDGEIDEEHEDCDYMKPETYMCSNQCRNIVT